MSSPSSWIVSEGFAGLLSQARGLAEAAGLSPELRVIKPTRFWRHIPAAFWPRPLSAIEPGAITQPLPDLAIGCGGKAASVLAALPSSTKRVIVQNPRMNPKRFDLVLAARHDELTGPNVIVTRTGLHRVTPALLAQAADEWRDRLAHLPRPLVAVMVGGSNGRFRLDAQVATHLGAQLADMMQRDHCGVILTPSRRSDPAVVNILSDHITPLGGEVWDGGGDNPYFGMLALADLIIVTADSVSMISEAVATTTPVMLVGLPGRSRRLGLFIQGLLDDCRIVMYQGRYENWPVKSADDTTWAAEEMRRRLGL